MNNSPPLLDVRSKLLKQESQSHLNIKELINYWQHQKVEQICRDIHEVSVLAYSTHSVTSEHVEIILACVKDLMMEIENTIPLSHSFKDKYMR